MQSIRRYSSCFCLAIGAALVLSLTTVSFGQSPTSGPSKTTPPPSTQPVSDQKLRSIVADREPLAKYIPQEASFYFRMSDQHKWESVWGESGKTDEPSENTFLPAGGSELQHHLRGQDRVIAMPTWRNRKEAITLCVPNAPAEFAKLLKTSETEVTMNYPGVEIYKSENKLWVATNGQVFVFSDWGLESAIFQQSAKLLTGEDHGSLLDDQRFQKYMVSLDEEASGVLFFDEAWKLRQGEEDVYQQYRPRWLPNLQSASVEIKFEPGLIRCKLHAIRREAQPPLTQAIQPKQLKLLPGNTIAAWVAPLNVESLVAAASRYLPQGKTYFYWQLARRLIDADMTGILSLAGIGPRNTFCLLEGSDVSQPRMAIIIEAQQAARVRELLAEICRGLVRMINIQRADRDEVVSIKTETYNGFPIHQLILSRPEEPVGLAGPLRELRPAFGEVAGQLVVASNPDAIKEIIVAYQSKAYAFPLSAEWATASSRPDDHTQIRAYLNPTSTARWLVPLRQAMEDSDSELLQSEWFQRLRDYYNDTPVQLGARLAKDNPKAPGKVYVLSVLEDRPAYDKLKPGDYIIAIDGQPLSLAHAREDLRKKLLAEPGGGQRILRVERYGQFKDVVINLPRVSHKSFHGLLANTNIAIRYLESLGKVVDHITYQQLGTNPGELNAEILFRLAGNL